jgi:hypothetical protein
LTDNFPKPGSLNMKRIIAMASLFSILSGLVTSVFAADTYQVADAYRELRNIVLTTKPESLGLQPRGNDVWGVVMETGYPGAVVSLVALADGTVSMYFSNGGGIIGLGPRPEPHRIGTELITSAQKFSLQAIATKIFPLPKVSYTRFYFLTGNGVVSVEAKEDDLGNWRHALSSLFHKAHELISAIRVIDEQRSIK